MDFGRLCYFRTGGIAEPVTRASEDTMLYSIEMKRPVVKLLWRILPAGPAPGRVSKIGWQTGQQEGKACETGFPRPV